MQLEQSFTLPQSPATVWPLFKNLELLVECLPGAALTGPAVNGEVPLRFDVKLGPIAAGFIGAGTVQFDDAAQAGRFEGQAADKRTNSRVKGAAAFALQPDAAGTRVAVTVDYALTGTLAQFSRGAIVKELASALTRQFAANLANRIESAAPPMAVPGAVQEEADASHAAAPQATTASASAPEAVKPAVAPAMPPAVPLNAWSLLKAVLAERWRRLWRRSPGPSAP